MNADEQRRFDEREDDVEAASVGRARAAGGGRVELTVEELALGLGRLLPPAPKTPSVSRP